MLQHFFLSQAWSPALHAPHDVMLQVLLDLYAYHAISENQKKVHIFSFCLIIADSLIVQASLNYTSYENDNSVLQYGALVYINIVAEKNA